MAPYVELVIIFVYRSMCLCYSCVFMKYQCCSRSVE